MPTPNLYVDVHEDDSGIDKSLKLLECPIEVRALKVGDVVIEHKQYYVGIEIKRVSDFQSSLFSGRLHDQINRLYDNFNYPVVIIQGVDEEYTNLDWFKKATATLNLRVATYVTEGQLETVELIGEFVRLLKENKFSVMKRAMIFETDCSKEVKFLCSLPYVSRRIAEELLEEYESPSRALEFIGDWVEINGITEERAKEIMKVHKGGD